MNPQFPEGFRPVKSNQTKPQFPEGFRPVKRQEDDVKPEVPQEEGLVFDDADIEHEAERGIARLTSRGIEQVVGAAGNAREFAYWVKDLYQKQIAKLPKKLHPPKSPLEDKNGEPNERTKEFKPLFGLIGSMIDYFPTSQDVKNFSEEKTGGYTSPKSETEIIGDEVFENIVASALPGTGQRNIWRNIAIPIASTLSKEGVKALGGTEKEQAGTQMGVAFVLNMINRGNAPAYSRQLYQNLEAQTPNATIPTGNMLRQANNTRNQLMQGLQAPSEQAVLNVVDRLIGRLQSGQLSAREAVAMKRSLNEIRGDPALLQRGRTLLNQVGDTLNSGVRQFEHQHPQFYQAWRDSNEVFGAIAQSNFTANFIQRHYSHPFLSKGMKELFAGTTLAGASALGAVPPIYAVYKGTQVMNRMANSPNLLRYYTNVITDSARGNVHSMTSNMQKLDEGLKKQEQEEETSKHKKVKKKGLNVYFDEEEQRKINPSQDQRKQTKPKK